MEKERLQAEVTKARNVISNVVCEFFSRFELSDVVVHLNDLLRTSIENSNGFSEIWFKEAADTQTRLIDFLTEIYELSEEIRQIEIEKAWVEDRIKKAS